MQLWTRRRKAAAAGVLALAAVVSFARAQTSQLHHLDQGAEWTPQTRAAFYDLGQGSELIRFAWLKALRQANGTRFLDAGLARFGFLSNAGDQVARDGLPIGFSITRSPEGPMVGPSCAACHTRQIEVKDESFRIDGAPSFVDYGAFLVALDADIHRLLVDGKAFQVFADEVAGTSADAQARAILHAEVRYWWTRFHLLVGKTLPGADPKSPPWGAGRLDATALTINTVAGLDLGVAPNYLKPGNIKPGAGPVRAPALWDAHRQDRLGWTGAFDGGNRFLTLASSLAHLYGTFGRFRPSNTRGSVTVLDRNYLTVNSVDFRGIEALDALATKLGAPRWPWPIDAALAAKGQAVFERPKAQGGCAECHGIRPGAHRTDESETWATTLADIGTDSRAADAWRRTVATGEMEGASIPGLEPPLAVQDQAFALVETAVVGTLVDRETALGIANPLRPLFRSVVAQKLAATAPADQPANVYAARVLRGVWATAPYLHDGSVPTLAELLKPPAHRTKGFKVGASYDPVAVGLAAQQDKNAGTYAATGCDDRASGNSNCGHEFGTALSDADKTALIEYMKSL